MYELVHLATPERRLNPGRSAVLPTRFTTYLPMSMSWLRSYSTPSSAAYMSPTSRPAGLTTETPGQTDRVAASINKARKQSEPATVIGLDGKSLTPAADWTGAG
ncbi:hypothetical protein MSIMFI_03789 [Mycobacterium simulans]|uniref:hypothetical protein n=1 Tax=Mycobacterium simulans TaxID=627089 RepID=UPI001748FCC7|nr:hypothetical protein [Mycobacterium simulans]SON62264.1 hypothetical protein MSIMFI_03789 [Mycobacterium simulans]